MTYYTVDATVWATNALTDTALLYGFNGDNYEKDPKKAVESMRRSDRGVASGDDSWPREMYFVSPYKKLSKLPAIFSAGGVWVVSQRFAEVLRRFELGKTTLHPVRLFQHDRTTPFDGEYFCLAFGETKDTFVPEESPEAGQSPLMSKDIWKPSLGREEYGLALCRKSLQGVDLWMEKKMMNVFFLSDRLYQALNAEKLAKPLAPYRCRVVSNRH
ncbi:imm11 family protein [Modicisalibacter coralii]|uniref:imm11 family protein n=1 Tax=Modicisalibacter coralii TaxID=2304602 RepID=UPI00100C0F9A|nr:hypothetical protein [Halomonas coralii]